MSRAKAVTSGDLARARLPVFKSRVARARACVETASSAIGRIGIAFSGGKDSTVTLDLVRSVVPDAPAAFMDSGCEYDSTYEMVRRYEVETIQPERFLLDMCRYAGHWGYRFPVDPDARFDFLAFLVYEPSYRWAQVEQLRVLAMGLRAEESAGRRMNARSKGDLYECAYDGLWHCCPLAFWNADDVWAYLASRELSYNAAYDRMAELGIPRDRWRISALLGLCGARTSGRFSYLRQLYPDRWNELVAEFPRIVEYT